MYGMVNDGVRAFIVANHGEDIWTSICRTADVPESYDRIAPYDDGVTYRLVGAVAHHTGHSTETVLKVFGTYWVEFAGSSNFGKLIRLAGNSFVEKVAGLDDLHDRILLSMPHLKPPSFELEQTGPKTYTLRYESVRDGLAPMVIGLLHGLAADSGESISVEQIADKGSGAPCDLFRITLQDVAEDG